MVMKTRSLVSLRFRVLMESTINESLKFDMVTVVSIKDFLFRSVRKHVLLV